jgi:hypothetical protein
VKRRPGETSATVVSIIDEAMSYAAWKDVRAMDNHELHRVLACIGADAMVQSILPPISLNGGPTNVLLGDSGVAHQIDVSVEMGDRLFLFDISAFPQAIMKQAFLEFWARALDIAIARDGRDLTVEVAVICGGPISTDVQRLAQYWHVPLRLAKCPEDVVHCICERLTGPKLPYGIRL